MFSIFLQTVVTKYDLLLHLFLERSPRLDREIFRQYSTMFDIIRQYLTLFGKIRYYLAKFRHYSTISDITSQYSAFFNNIWHFLKIIFHIIRHYSTLFDAIRHFSIAENVSVYNFYCWIMSRTSKRVAIHSGGEGCSRIYLAPPVGKSPSNVDQTNSYILITALNNTMQISSLLI